MLVPRKREPAKAPDSPTFSRPPLDHSLTLPEIYEWHAEHSPQHPLFIYENSPGVNKTILWSQAGRGIVRASNFVRNRVEGGYEAAASQEAPVVALLATLGLGSVFSSSPSY